METILTLIGNKWKVLILRDLLPGTKRFGEWKKSIGSVSQKVLTAQLRNMEENGLIYRKVYAAVPPKAEYSLIDLGKSLKPILDALLVGIFLYQPRKHILCLVINIGKVVVQHMATAFAVFLPSFF